MLSQDNKVPLYTHCTRISNIQSRHLSCRRPSQTRIQSQKANYFAYPTYSYFAMAAMAPPENPTPVQKYNYLLANNKFLFVVCSSSSIHLLSTITNLNQTSAVTGVPSV